MNRADETFQVSEIISRYVLGSMTESEKEELDGWLDRSPRNKLLFEELVRQEVASGKILRACGMGGGIERIVGTEKEIEVGWT